jgi:hypothetical protein
MNRFRGGSAAPNQTARRARELGRALILLGLGGSSLGGLVAAVGLASRALGR